MQVPIANAVPAQTHKRVVWEYATLDLKASRPLGNNKYKYGADLYLPNGRILFLESKNYDSIEYRNYLLNRLGAQGWELIEIISFAATEYRYIFKRQK